MIVKCPSCHTDHQLIRYIRKNNKSEVGVICDKHPIVRIKRGISSVVDHTKFFPCYPEHAGLNLREVFTPMAKREAAQKGQTQFVMTYQTTDERTAIDLKEKLDAQLAEKKQLERQQQELAAQHRKLELEARQTSAKLSEIETMRLV